MRQHNDAGEQPKRFNIAIWVFGAIILYFLITEHGAHVVPYLPFALLLLCPLMHIFMHGGHGGHGDRDEHASEEREHKGHNGHCGHGRHHDRDRHEGDGGGQNKGGA